jgi:hypothetical protein
MQTTFIPTRSNIPPRYIHASVNIPPRYIHAIVNNPISKLMQSQAEQRSRATQLPAVQAAYMQARRSNQRFRVYTTYMEYGQMLPFGKPPVLQNSSNRENRAWHGCFLGRCLFDAKVRAGTGFLPVFLSMVRFLRLAYAIVLPCLFRVLCRVPCGFFVAMGLVMLVGIDTDLRHLLVYLRIR